MQLESINFHNFRNFADLKLEMAGMTLLIGDNAQGKSNLLEGVYFLATAKSLRVEKDVQLIKWGGGFCRVEGEVAENELADKSLPVVSSSNSDITKLEIAMQIVPEGGERVEKRVKVNGVPRRVSDYLGNLVVVYFAPEDINLVTGSPSKRRDWLDLTLAQVDKEYKREANRYNDALSARNRLLKKIRGGEATTFELDFWTEQLLESGSHLTGKRDIFFRQLNKKIASLGQFHLDYQINQISEERLKQTLAREIEAAMTLIGPHRDDFTFQLDGQNLAFFGSRGEQRTAVLELKLAELEYVKETIGSDPILLLDDVFSELDETHRRFVGSLVEQQQTIITAVENEQIPKELVKEAKVVRVEQGKIAVV